MKKVALLLVVALQIVTIGFLLGRIYVNYSEKNVLGAATNIAPLDKNDLIFPANSEFKYYDTLPVSTQSGERRYWDNTYAHYSFNQDGLNERFDYSISKSEGVFRIVTLGDSFTFGHFVDTRDNWTEQLEDLLNKQNICSQIKKFEVINLGMRGFDIPYIVKRYNDYGLKYHPDLIIWFESGSGFQRDNELTQPIIQDCQSKMASKSSNILTKEKFYKCWNVGYTQMLKDKTEEDIEKNLNKWMTNFLTLKNLTPVLFTGFSNFDSNQKDKLQKRSNGQSNVFVMNTVSDITSKNGMFPLDGHPNVTGHTIIAKDIFNYLINSKVNLMQCNQ